MNFIKKTKSFIERTIQYDSIFLKFQKQAKIFVPKTDKVSKNMKGKLV